MNKILFSLLTLFIFGSTTLSAQNDPVLFTVDDVPVHVSEFKYIYDKTNGAKADYSQASLEEYLDLYEKFKLKVRRAKDMQLDTIPTLQKELEGYRKQLADSYLIDREVTDRLIKEAYERQSQDVDISHILFALAPNATPADTLKLYQEVAALKAQVQDPVMFGQIAKERSADKSAKRNSGHLGYVTALFPNGYYALETAAYEGEIGQVVGPLRTSAGYHLVKVNARRPARGEMEIAHILIRKPKPNSGGSIDDAKNKINVIHRSLQNGGTFELLAKEQSEDKLTAPKGGYIGFFGINRYEKTFEDAAFALANDGDYTEPIETTVGYHILKRINKKEDQPFNLAQSRLESKIKQDARFELAKRSMINRIKTESNFAAQDKVLQQFIESLGEEFLTYKWKAPKEKSPETLFAFGGDEMKVSLGDFTDYLRRASRKRIQMGRSASVEQAVTALFNDFVNEQALAYEERQLEKKYPEFKALMREYEEGILLFEATKMLVWDKASQDTTGLRNYYDKYAKGKHRWQDRAMISQYSLKASAKDMIEEVRKYAKKHTPEETLAKFNTDDKKVLTYQSKTFEKGRNEVLDAMEWKVNNLSKDETSKRDQSTNFFKIEELIKPQPKTLKEARGYVVADYQDFLEKQWLEELRKDYEVKVNDKVFKKMVK
ncbi:MAG: peptidylprolyl isomerase [Saprospiraceae bacterium]